MFLPYLLFTLYVIQRVSNFTFTYPALALSMSSFHIQLRAFYAAITGQRSSFNVSSKVQLEGNLISFAAPQLIYIGAAVVGVVVAYLREGFSPSLINNFAWVALNVVIFIPFIRSALPERKKATSSQAARPVPVATGFIHEEAYGPA